MIAVRSNNDRTSVSITQGCNVSYPRQSITPGLQSHRSCQLPQAYNRTGVYNLSGVYNRSGSLDMFHRLTDRHGAGEAVGSPGSNAAGTRPQQSLEARQKHPQHNQSCSCMRIAKDTGHLSTQDCSVPSSHGEDTCIWIEKEQGWR